jgi:methylenetetrahydrofolate reductase (NADPH)
LKVIDHLQQAERPLISFEIIPPLRGGDLASLLNLIETLAKYRPPFIDITSHSAEVVYDETPTGYQKRIKRKRPGTLGVCALIQKKFEIDAVPHLLVQGFTTQETEDFLIELHYLGIDNVLAIRGDSNGYQKPLEHGRTRHDHAIDLIAQIRAMNQGVYLEDLLDASPTDFCIGAAGYPEKHFEAPNLASDIAWVKRKVEAGAEYIVTQMFFDNRHYFSFVNECRSQGIDVPIIPGLKILTTRTQLTSLPRTFHCEIPPGLAEAVERSGEGEVTEAGVNWTLRQAQELMAAGVPAVHIYVMQRSRAIQMLMDRLVIPGGF